EVAAHRADVPPAEVERFDLTEVRDRTRAPGLGLWDLERPGGGLARPRVVAAAELAPRAADPGHAGPRQGAGLGALARPEGDDVHAGVAGDQRVGRAAQGMKQAVAGGDGVGPAVLPAQPGAAEDVEDLLLAGVAVHRRRAATRRQVDA